MRTNHFATILLIGNAYRYCIENCEAFSPSFTRNVATTRTAFTSTLSSPTALASESKSKTESMGEYEKKNAAVELLSNFMQNDNNSNNEIDTDPLGNIDFDVPKFQKVDLETLAQVLDYELTQKEWFVTGNVNPAYFSENFEFQDPDVKLSGIENYARGVNKLFDQDVSRAEIKSVVVNTELENTITVYWRLSGRVNIGPKLNIKPYMCSTNFRVEAESGLIDFQEDFFDIPQWDVLLSALFPFLIGKITSEPAPPVERPDKPVMPVLKQSTDGVGILDAIFDMFQKT